jgi:hypothetical protein
MYFVTLQSKGLYDSLGLPNFDFYFTANMKYLIIINKQIIPWLQSASELYRPGDRRLSAKLVPTFADRGVSRWILYGQNLGFLDRSRYFFFQRAPQLYSRG